MTDILDLIDNARPGQWWRGISQDSWWLIQHADDEQVHALCLREPQRYAWVDAGETITFPRPSFEQGMELMFDALGSL